tara:strand:- start:623 stop:769 length:147 start_codon:yes stop_codon:yes gene_type:complete
VSTKVGSLGRTLFDMKILKSLGIAKVNPLIHLRAEDPLLVLGVEALDT